MRLNSTLDFVPAMLTGCEDLPIVAELWDRDRFVPWLRDLLSQHWALNSGDPFSSVFFIPAQSPKATMLRWARQLWTPTIQGHRFSGTDRCVASYSRHSIIPMVRLQSQVSRLSAVAPAACSLWWHGGPCIIETFQNMQLFTGFGLVETEWFMASESFCLEKPEAGPLALRTWLALCDKQWVQAVVSPHITSLFF